MTQFMLIRAQKCIKSSNVLLRAGNRDIWIAVIITVCMYYYIQYYYGKSEQNDRMF